MISRGSKHFPKYCVSILNDLVLEYKDVFRITLRKDRPVIVEPMKIEFWGTDKANQSTATYILSRTA